MVSFVMSVPSPSPTVLLKIFETNALGPDLVFGSLGLNVAVRLAPDWLVAGLIIAGVSRGWRCVHASMGEQPLKEECRGKGSCQLGCDESGDV